MLYPDLLGGDGQLALAGNRFYELRATFARGRELEVQWVHMRV